MLNKREKGMKAALNISRVKSFEKVLSKPITQAACNGKQALSFVLERFISIESFLN